MLKIYALTILSSAFLLFLVQPMIAKAVLPHLGGAPSVWNVAMVVFQALLLGGYAYVHAINRALGIRKAAKAHTILVLLSLLALPVALRDPESIDAIAHPQLWMLVSLSLSVGLPFFFLSSNAPMLQLWFAQSDHKQAHNPYMLYSASNIGSFAALLGFPFVIERSLTLSQQMGYWSVGYALFVLLLGVCAALLFRCTLPEPHEAIQAEAEEKISAARWWLWVLLAFIPSSLMLGVTQFITTDVAAVPLLWIMPLALYLLSFIIVFGTNRAIGHQRFYWLVMLALMVLIYLRVVNAIWPLPVHLLLFFLLAVAFHGLLVQRKPSPVHLASFYLAMSVGGVMGGAFNALVAPMIFASVQEYFLVVLLGLLTHFVLYQLQKHPGAQVREFLLILAIMWVSHSLLSVISEAVWPDSAGLDNERLIPVGVWAFVFIFYVLVKKLAVWQRDGLILLLFIQIIAGFSIKTGIIFEDRNFFGVSRVLVSEKANAMTYYHGTTMHGVQSLHPSSPPKFTSYYSHLGEIMAFADQDLRHAPMLAIGMGVGTVACHALPGQEIEFIEIDSLVVRIASNPQWFTFLSDCPGEVKVTVGDGRIEASKKPDHYYSVIIADAYSSDALPIHLLTKEAVAMYLSKLRSGGVLAFHITNRHLNLAPILASMANDLQVPVLSKSYPKDTQDPLVFTTDWVIMTYNQALIERLISDNGWQPLPAQENGPVWSDDFSNILDVLRVLH